MRSLLSRRFVWAGLAVWVLAVAAGWGALIWRPAIFAMLGLLVVSLVLVSLGHRPAGDTHERRVPAARQPMAAPTLERREPTPYRYPLLRPEDEAEVERLYQRLKTVGRLDSKSSTDEM
jgi:hypothetical protein